MAGYCIAGLLSLCITIPMSMHQDNFKVSVTLPHCMTKCINNKYNHKGVLDLRLTTQFPWLKNDLKGSWTPGLCYYNLVSIIQV